MRVVWLGWPRFRWSWLGLEADLPVGLELRRARCPGGFPRSVRGAALGGGSVGLFDGAETGGDPGLASGDGVAVAAAVGAFGQVLAKPFDFADVGFAFVGVGGDGEQGDVGGGVV